MFNKDVDIWVSYTIVLVPIAVYVFVCVRYQSSVQLRVAAVLGSIYSLIMVFLVTGAIANIANSAMFISPTSILFVTIFAVFFFAALLHPHEFAALVHGPLYFMSLPVVFIFMNIYAVANLNNVSWGTRESNAPAARGDNNNNNRRQHKLSSASGTATSWLDHESISHFKLEVCIETRAKKVSLKYL